MKSKGAIEGCPRSLRPHGTPGQAGIPATDPDGKPDSQFCPSNQSRGAPHLRFPVKFSGLGELNAPFLKERRTLGPVEHSVQEIRGISLVFREMWDTTAPYRPTCYSLNEPEGSAVQHNPI